MTPSNAPPPTHCREWSASGSDAHQAARLASGIRSAARDGGVVVVSHGCTEVVASDVLERGGQNDIGQIGVTRLGDGVVIHTLSDGCGGLAVVLGYADGHGEWFRDGTRYRHREAIG